MDDRLRTLYNTLKARGLTAEQERVIEHELRLAEEQDNDSQAHFSMTGPRSRSVYSWNDLQILHDASPPRLIPLSSLSTLDSLLDRDRQREEDGFPRKIRVGRMMKPGRDGSDKVVVVPSTVEEKLYHDRIKVQDETEAEGEAEGGSGEGEEGEVIGEQPVREEQGPGDSGAGQGEGGSHELESNAYDLGRVLTEQFKLPNLRDKGKKRSLTRYTYDLTDKHRGFGQILDKKATLRRIIQTNIALQRISGKGRINALDLAISPRDRVYRILSREKDYESQAMVFFVRDYSGSMSGKPTELVVSQHVLIFSWLAFQYQNQVKTRFILHDTEAKEVVNFHTYANLRVAGGTQVASAYRLVNRIVEKENLERDYNIYVFHGTDGDDWDTKGEEALPELRKMLRYAARVGITIAENGYGVAGKSEVERYIRRSGLLDERNDLLRLDVMGKDSNEGRVIDGIRHLIS
jgi:hypothetical protein